MSTWLCCFPAAGFISATLKAPPLNYVHIPAASLPRDRGGILWCSVDAVSDTFRFLPFIFFFFFPPTHTATLHSCWWMQLKTCDLPKYRGGGWKSSDVQSTAAIFVANYKRHKWRNPQVFWFLHVSHSTENLSDLFCFTEHVWYEDQLHLNIDSDQIHMIYRNFSQQMTKKVGYVTKAFYRKISHRKCLTPNHQNAVESGMWFLWNSSCIYTTPACTQIGLFQRFHFQVWAHVLYSHPCEMGLAIVTLHIYSSPSSGVILYYCCTAHIFFFYSSRV